MTWRFLGRGLVFLLLGLACLLENGVAQGESNCTAALQDYQVALRSYEDGLLDPAIAGFESYLRRCPDAEHAAQAHYLLGEIFYKRQRFPDALHHATQVISNPTQTALHPHALLLAAQCTRALGQLDQTATYLQQVLASKHATAVLPAALYWLGELAFQQQRYEAARAYYQRVVAAPQPGPYAAYAQYALGWLYRQLGDAAAALKAFSAFLDLAPEHEFALQARFARAALLRDTEQLPEAAEAFQHLAQEAPADLQDEALFWWAETAYQLERYAEASTVYQRLVTEYPQSARINASLYGWGWAEIQQHHYAAALHPLQTLLQNTPHFPQALEVHYQLGECYIQLEQSALARQHLVQVVEASPPTAHRQDALLQLAALAFQEAVYPEAIRYYTLALTAASPQERLRLHYFLAESYAALRQPAPAIKHWQQALAGPPTHPLRAQILFHLGNAYMAQHEWTQAISVLRQLWDDFPAFDERTTVAVQLVRAYRETQQCAEALRFYDTIINTAVESGQRQRSVVAKALCLFELGQYADVIQLLAPLLASSANQALEPQVFYMLGQAYLQLHQDQAALESWSLLHQRFPGHPLTVTAEPLLARMLEHAGRREEALTIWKAFLRRGTIQGDEELARLQLHVGQLAFQAGRLTEVLDFLAPVRGAASPALAAEALFRSGEVYLQQQRWELAFQVYQELIDRYLAELPWSTLARLRVGMIYEHQHDWERALQVYQSLLTATTDEELRANVRRRIAAIEAGRVVEPQQTPRSASEG
jgi:tetratricopeptide (TPR) repeat protein